MKSLLIIIMMFSLIGCVYRQPMPIRPVTIRVVDQETKKPLEGVRVYYALGTCVFQKYILLVIPSLHPDIGDKIAYKAKAVTNQNGEVRFHAKDFMLPRNERFEMEYIFVNMDVDMTTKTALYIKDLVESYYAIGRVSRVDPVGLVDILDFLIVGGEKYRDEALFRSNANYIGVYLRNQSLQLLGGDMENFAEGVDPTWFDHEPYDLLWGGKSLLKDEDLFVVGLKPVDSREYNR